MRKIFAILLVITSFANAQFYQIDYDLKTQAAFTNEGLNQFSQAVPDVKQREMILDGMKNIPIMNYIFSFNESESKTVFELKVNNSQTQQGPFTAIPPAEIGINSIVKYNEKMFYDEVDVMGKKFLAYDSIHFVDFKETGKTKEILGKKVKEAIGKFQQYDLIAWHDDSNPKHFSPDGFYGTKGLILELHYKYVKDGVEVITSWIPTKITTLKSAPVFKLNDKLKKIQYSEIDIMYEEFNQKQREEMNSGVDKK